MGGGASELLLLLPLLPVAVRPAVLGSGLDNSHGSRPAGHKSTTRCERACLFWCTVP